MLGCVCCGYIGLLRFRPCPSLRFAGACVRSFVCVASACAFCHCVCACVCACVRACVRACVHACVLPPRNVGARGLIAGVTSGVRARCGS